LGGRNAERTVPWWGGGGGGGVCFSTENDELKGFQAVTKKSVGGVIHPKGIEGGRRGGKKDGGEKRFGIASRIMYGDRGQGGGIKGTPKK